MKDEGEPVTPDEFVIRLIWWDFYDATADPVLHPKAFLPKPSETDGISVFRAACLSDPTEVLAVIAEEKRGKYAVAMLPVSEVVAVGLTVQPAKIDAIPGHTVLPELNATAVGADRPRWKLVQKRLAEIASKNVVRVPTAPRQ
ncbi:MAG TPA: hypothetical protein VM533_05015 [Fimbriiglobus sp.]|jgi:hypothetical protein|nr:hypothetical protein [Fimbriiglobus sp.]